MASSISKESTRASNPKVKVMVAEVAIEDQSRAANTRRRMSLVATPAVDTQLRSTTKSRLTTRASPSSSTLRRELRKTTKEHPKRMTSSKLMIRSLLKSTIKSILEIPNLPRRGYRRLRLVMELSRV